MTLIRPLCAGLLLLGGSTGWAEAGKPPLLVLQLEAKGASALEVEGVTLSVVRGLRELDVFSLLSADDIRQLLALERGRQLLGTEAQALGDIGKALGARHAVAGAVIKLGDTLQVDLRLLDTAQSTVLAQKTLGPVEKMDQLAAALPGLAQELVGPLLQNQQGSLLVRAREEGAEILVDGVLVGSQPMKASLKFPRGNHRLQVRKDGFIALTRSVRIDPDQLTVEEVTLVPSADFAEAYRVRHDHLRTGAWIASASALGLLAGALILDRAGTEPRYQNQFLPIQAALRQQPLTGSSSQEVYDRCSADLNSCNAHAQTLGRQLQLMQATTTVLAVTGGVAALAAGYMWWVGQDPNRYVGLVASVSVGPHPGFTLSGGF